MAYGAGDTLARAVMHRTSHLPADDIVADFAFKGSSAPPVAFYTTILGWISDFFNFVGVPGGHAISEFIGIAVDRSVTQRIDFFHIQAGGLGSPVASLPWLGPSVPLNPSQTALQVAAVLSFKGDTTGVLEFGPVEEIPSTESAIDQGAPFTHPGRPRPKARRRGRLFVGPLTSQAINNNLAIATLNNNLTQAMRDAALKLKSASASTAPWSVWSRRDATLYPIVDGWTDDRPDTQRRRVPAATGRAVWGP